MLAALDTPAKAASRLAVVAVDMSTGTKVVFSEQARLYGKGPESVNPERFVCASVSITYVFFPQRLPRLPTGEEAVKRWVDVGADAGTEKDGVPGYSLFVAGGIMSNFPIETSTTAPALRRRRLSRSNPTTATAAT